MSELKNPERQGAALRELENLARSRSAGDVIKLGAINHVVELLAATWSALEENKKKLLGEEEEEEEAQAQEKLLGPTVSALAMLAADEDNVDMVAAADAVLVNVFLDPGNPTAVKMDAARALTNLVVNARDDVIPHRIMDNADVVQVIVDMLDSDCVEMQAVAANGLKNLAYDDYGQIKIAAAAQGHAIQRLVALIRDPDSQEEDSQEEDSQQEEVQVAALGALTSLACYTDNAAKIGDAGAVSLAMAMLALRNSQVVQGNAAALLRNLVLHPCNAVTFKNNKNIDAVISRVVHLLTTDNPEVHVYAAGER